VPVLVVFDEKLVDGLFQSLDGLEHAAGEASLGVFGREPFDGIEPGGGCWGEMEGPQASRCQLFFYFRVIMGGVVADDGTHMLAGRHDGLNPI
jgi:hypothetical protein